MLLEGFHPADPVVVQELALDAVTTVMAEASTGQREIDIKKYVKIEKIPGGAIEDCRWAQMPQIVHFETLSYATTAASCPDTVMVTTFLTRSADTNSFVLQCSDAVLAV